MFLLGGGGFMYASTRRYEGVTDPVQAARLVQEGFVPLIRGMPGFVAYFWADAGGGVMVSTTVFENQTAAEESNRQAASWAKEHLKDVLPRPPQISIGPVVAAALGRAEAEEEEEREASPP
jgi:hypothetical protein